MRSALIAALVGASLVPAVALAQQPTVAQQTAAIEAPVAAPAAPSAAGGAPVAAPAAPSAAGGLTRDQFIQRAKDRAGQRAASRFDEMDADHDGVLDRAEIRAWRSQHPRHAAATPSQPASQ